MYWLIVVLEMNQRLKETTVLRVFFIKFINVASQAVTERLYRVKERDSSCLWLCKSSWKTILNCKNLREDKEVKGQEVASVLTYKTAMEFENKKKHTHTVVFRGVSPMPFRMNALWCQRDSLCAHRQNNREGKSEKEEWHSKRGYMQEQETSFY